MATVYIGWLLWLWVGVRTHDAAMRAERDEWERRP